MSMSSDGAETPDATLSTQTLPRQSSRPLKPLVPRPIQAERLSLRPLTPSAPRPIQARRPVFHRSAISRATASVAGLRSCPICPLFQRRGCQLTSHSSYVKQFKRRPQPGDGTTQSRSRQNAVDDTVYANSYAFHFVQSFVDRNVAAGKVDPFYPLPVPDNTHPQMHALFQHFFTVQLNRAVNFPRPSCFTSDPVGGVLAPAAMVDPLVCLSVISISAMTAGMRLGQPARNPSAQSLYCQAMRMLHDRLCNDSTTDETILGATTLSIISTSFGVEAAVRQNRKTVRDLVRSRGDASPLGMGGALAEYLTMAEIFAALWLKDEPRPYVVAEAMPGSLTAPPAAVYGAAFYSPHILESLQPNMLEICFTMCRMTEVLEKAMREGATPLEYIYFYSTLRWVSIRRAQFRAWCYNSGTKDECISNVIEIFRINAFSTQPEGKSLNFGFCSQLQRALMRTNISSYWEEQIQMLIWVLFVVATIEFEWESRQWFMDLLRWSISHKYGDVDWPHTWRQETMQNLKSFLWSDLRLTESFDNICNKLEKLANRQGETERNSLSAPGEASGSK